MALLGICIFALCIAYFVNEYSKDMKKKAVEYNACVDLLCTFKAELSACGKSFFEIISCASSDALIKSGLLEKVKNISAENSCRWRDEFQKITFLLDSEDKECLVGYLVAYGKSSLDEEIKRAADTLSYFEEKTKKIKDTAEKNIKVAWLLFATVFIGVVILIL